MKNNLRRVVVGITALTCTLVAPFGARGAEPATTAPGSTVTGDTIILGQTAAQSGPQAPIGASKWGLEAFIGSVNARGGVAGKKLRLISYDDGYQPAQTTA